MASDRDSGNVLRRMKDDWDSRAATDPMYYIASSCESGESEFRKSGARDVGLFFAGLEYLLAPDAVVVDIGCGIGRMDEFVASRVGRLLGFDVSRVMVDKARTRLGAVSNAAFYENDGYRLSVVADDSADVVFSHVVFQHVPREVMEAYFREAHRVLRAGGAFVFQVPEFVGQSPPAVPAYGNTWDMRFYSEAEIRESLLAVGFVWREPARARIETSVMTFNQLRVHVGKAR
jgi:SAM-dependent methyltransferase